MNENSKEIWSSGKPRFDLWMRKKFAAEPLHACILLVDALMVGREKSVSSSSSNSTSVVVFVPGHSTTKLLLRIVADSFENQILFVGNYFQSNYLEQMSISFKTCARTVNCDAMNSPKSPMWFFRVGLNKSCCQRCTK